MIIAVVENRQTDQAQLTYYHLSEAAENLRTEFPSLKKGLHSTYRQITNQLGKGGVGEVFQAKDQKLGRDVAITVFPEEFAGDADRLLVLMPLTRTSPEAAS